MAKLIQAIMTVGFTLEFADDEPVTNDAIAEKVNDVIEIDPGQVSVTDEDVYTWEELVTE